MRLYATWEVMRLTGATEGQLHRWAHRGLVPLAHRPTGSGDRRKYDAEGVFVAAVLADMFAHAEDSCHRSSDRQVADVARHVPSIAEARGHVLACGRDGWSRLVLTDVPEWVAHEPCTVVVVLDAVLDRLTEAA